MFFIKFLYFTTVSKKMIVYSNTNSFLHNVITTIITSCGPQMGVFCLVLQFYYAKGLLFIVKRPGQS